ncbi:Olfactory receptor 1009 [Camelus dromedarius]|uniref:Olfactory receptor 1009 n=1 Tax=Camelus dromedarius TaxID=9838 RepID=A0A5N4DPN3_CAMDR|nr:Olfactory receptor 1009 [Camelus dromedarius]
MYSFLSHLSFVDTCFSSVVGPKVLADFFAERKAISFLGCALQQWFSGFFVAIECLLLASMAYDRYVAICRGAVFSLDLNKVVSIFYTAVIPMLNPIIYSLRNKEVKAAMCRTITRRKFCIRR